MPTPQEIRDRLAKVEDVLADTWTQAKDRSIDTASATVIATLSNAKATILQAAATTLLVEQQEITNKLLAAQVYALTGMPGQATAIVEEVRRG